jgi:hypothetical protein
MNRTIARWVEGENVAASARTSGTRSVRGCDETGVMHDATLTREHRIIVTPDHITAPATAGRTAHAIVGDRSRSPAARRAVARLDGEAGLAAQRREGGPTRIDV